MEALDLSKIEINAEENDNKTSLSKHLRDLEKFEKKRMVEGLIVFSQGSNLL